MTSVRSVADVMKPDIVEINEEVDEEAKKKSEMSENSEKAVIKRVDSSASDEEEVQEHVIGVVKGARVAKKEPAEEVATERRQRRGEDWQHDLAHATDKLRDIKGGLERLSGWRKRKIEKKKLTEKDYTELDELLESVELDVINLVRALKRAEEEFREAEKVVKK